MKIRVDFVTNSSSDHYIVKNISETTKTMLDLLREAATDDDGRWEAKPECYLYNWEKYHDGESIYEYPWNREAPHADDPEFLEDVAAVMEFPPKQEVEVILQWVFEQGYLRLREKTENFEIKSLD